MRQAFTNKDGSRDMLQLVSSNTSLDWTQVTTICHRWWKVEEFHTPLKQHASLGKSPTKTVTTQINHFLAATPSATFESKPSATSSASKP